MQVKLIDLRDIKLRALIKLICKLILLV